MTVKLKRTLYRTGHYFNGQGTSFGGSQKNNGYYGIKAHKINASTHRLLAWLWPRDGRRPVMPWKFEVDHIDGDNESLEWTNLQWLTKKQHANKTRSSKQNDGKSNRIIGVRTDGVGKTFESLAEACRQTGCRLDGVSNTANGKQRATRTKAGDVWLWVWCDPEPDREGEEWRPCVLPNGATLDDLYVSNYGMFKRLKNGRILKFPGCLEKSGYRRVYVKGPLLLAHRLVAFTWLPPPQPEQTVVDHIDCSGAKDDNRVSNLRWATTRANLANADRRSGADSLSVSVQPFFDPELTQAAHEPFASQKDAAEWVGIKGTASMRKSINDPSLHFAGKLDGRPLYWKRCEDEAHGPGAEVTPELMLHMRACKSKEIKERLAEEDARLPDATCLFTSAAPEGSEVFFEGDDGLLHFYARDGRGEDNYLGHALVSDVYKLTARYEDGHWRVFTF